MQYKILRSFVKRDRKSYKAGEIVGANEFGEVGDLIVAKFIEPIGNERATITPITQIDIATEEKVNKNKFNKKRK